MKVKSNRELSFKKQLETATKEDLMKKYCLTESDFERQIARLEKIKSGVIE